MEFRAPSLDCKKKQRGIPLPGRGESFRNCRQHRSDRRGSTTQRRCYRFFRRRYRRYLLISVRDISNREEFMREERCPVPFTACFSTPPWESTQIRKCNATGLLSRAITRVYARPPSALFPWDARMVFRLRLRGVALLRTNESLVR